LEAGLDNRTRHSPGIPTCGRRRSADAVQAALRRLMTVLFRRHDHVILFAFAKQDVFAEKQIVRRYGTGGTGLADVVDIHAAVFDVFTRLVLGRTKSGKNYFVLSNFKLQTCSSNAPGMCANSQFRRIF